jgi:threonine dehydratase
MKLYEPVSIEMIRAAQKRIADEVIHTPLIRLNIDNIPTDIFLKLENLQPIRSFKMRAAGNTMKLIDRKQLEGGVWSVSAGNWAQGIAWYARQLGVKCTIVLPDDAPQTKQDAIRRLGAHIEKVPYADVIQITRTNSYDGMKGLFIPFNDPPVMAGNGTIGLEILEDLPDVDSVIIPWGVGGLCCGIASAVRALKPKVKLYACEVNTAAPLAASFEAGEPVEVDFTPSFVDGIGIPFVLPEMYHLAKKLLNGSIVVGLDEVAAAIRLLAHRNCVVSEGAGAVSVAAVISGKAGLGKIVCIVSGGNIDTTKLIKILQG